MSTVIPQRDLRNHNAGIIERVVAGESFVVTRDGVPVADVTPHAPTNRPPMFPKTVSLSDFLAPPRVDAEAWLTEIRASDDFIDDNPIERSDPWERDGG